MMVAIATHWALELGGSCAWACLRGRCQHRRHRIALDLVATLLASALTVRLLG
jgi:hypothetical protein